MFRKLFIVPAFLTSFLVVSCNFNLVPQQPDPSGGGIDDPATGELPIRARVRNESTERVDVTIRFVSQDDPVRLAFLRVPPEIRTCHQAIAWTAGFSDSESYQPALET